MKRPSEVSMFMRYFMSFMLFYTVIPILPALFVHVYVNGLFDDYVISGVGLLPSITTFMIKMSWDTLVTIDDRLFGFLTCLKLIFESIVYPRRIV